jgi:hypothetical protein
MTREENEEKLGKAIGEENELHDRGKRCAHAHLYTGGMWGRSSDSSAMHSFVSCLAQRLHRFQHSPMTSRRALDHPIYDCFPFYLNPDL